jgi:hypothetical protein
MNRLCVGLAGGLVGSALMTAFMRRMHRELPSDDRYPLPPRQIAMTLAEKSGLGPPAREENRKALTLAAHYGYGTALGGLYGLIAPKPRWARLAAGIPFALAVWAGSYLGWLPAAGIHPPATAESAPRNALMIGAHFVWAGAIALIVAMPASERHDRASSSLARRT